MSEEESSKDNPKDETDDNSREAEEAGKVEKQQSKRKGFSLFKPKTKSPESPKNSGFGLFGKSSPLPVADEASVNEDDKTTSQETNELDNVYPGGLALTVFPQGGGGSSLASTRAVIQRQRSKNWSRIQQFASLCLCSA